MSRNQSSATPEVRVEKHPPERRRSKTVTTHCGCCCCCCCCLHSVGALIGAAMGSAVPPHNEDKYFVGDADDPELYRKLITRDESPGSPGKVVGTLWLTTLLLCVLSPFGAGGGDQ